MYTCGRFILIFGLNFFFQKYTIHLKKPWPQSQCEARYRDFLCESNSADFLSYQSGSFVKGKVFNFITAAAAAAAKLLQSCPTLWDPIDGSPTGSPVPAILQARTLEWVAISFSNAWKWKEKVKSLSRVRLSTTPWTAAHQAPPPMGFSRQEYWSRVPFPSP